MPKLPMHSAGSQEDRDIDAVASTARCLLEIDQRPNTPLEIAKAVDKATKFLFPYRPFNPPDRHDYLEKMQRRAFMIIMNHFGD